jgi:hypothetical protein
LGCSWRVHLKGGRVKVSCCVRAAHV